MKIRLGFVSNSSSSSFVIVTTKENHDKAMKELSAKEKKYVQAVLNEASEKKKLGAVEVIMISTRSSDYGTIEQVRENQDLPVLAEDEDDPLYEYWDKYLELVQKDEDNYITHSEDF